MVTNTTLLNVVQSVRLHLASKLTFSPFADSEDASDHESCDRRKQYCVLVSRDTHASEIRPPDGKKPGQHLVRPWAEDHAIPSLVSDSGKLGDHNSVLL